MVAYNFQGRFADAVESGEKHQTIRAEGKRRHAHPGDKLQLYSGQRTKSCRKLREAICDDVMPIKINEDGVTICGTPVIDLELLARLDGFISWAEMRDWFAKVHGLPFKGIMIQWLIPTA